MFIVHSYPLAIFFCVITMICWGSWGNTQKLAARSWRFELFYWDYVIGILLFSVLSAITLGSIGSNGRSFLTDLHQAASENILSAFIGGIIFNAANILFSAAIALAGMSVAFPIAIGLALVLGVIINYSSDVKGDPVLLFGGVAMITIAILLNAVAYRRRYKKENGVSAKGITVALVAGLLMSWFYRFVAASMDLNNFSQPQPGKMTPYTAVFIFSIGVFVSNILFNTILIKKPITGPPTSYATYFKAKFSTHLTGLLGGIIWGLGNSLNLIAAGKAGAAISYGLGQGATLIAALWGVLVWKEFKDSPKTITRLLTCMFLFFAIGLIFIIAAGNRS